MMRGRRRSGARAHMLSKLEASDASEHMLDEWDQRHCAFHSAIVAGGSTTPSRCANAYLTAARYTALFGWLRNCSPVRRDAGR